MSITDAIILDLETVPNELSPLWEAKNSDRDFVPALYQKIVCAGVCRLDNSFNCTSIVALADYPEKEIVRWLSEIITPKTLVVTWYGRKFDMPLILYRAMKYKIPFPVEKESDFRNRYKYKGHFDLQDHMSWFGMTEGLSLDHASALLGLPGKMDTKGSEVEDLYARGQLGKIKSYCTTDIIQTAIIFARYSYIVGLANKEEANNLLSSIEDLSTNEALRIQDDDVLSGIRQVIQNCDWKSLFV